MKQFVIFKLFNQNCGVPLDEVTEVCRLRELVKSTISEISIVKWRDKKIPVLDLYSMTSKNFRQTAVTPDTRIVILKKESGKEFGILVDEVLAIETVEEADVLSATIRDARYIVGRIEREAYHIKVLDVNVFIQGDIGEVFPLVYETSEKDFNKGERIYGMAPHSSEEVADEMKLKAINWLIGATKKQLEEKFIKEMEDIYQLMIRL